MRFHYDQKGDSLYIDLSGHVSTESQEVAPGVVIDLDSSGTIVGIDIENASRVVNLARLDVDSLPISDLSVSAA